MTLFSACSSDRARQQPKQEQKPVSQIDATLPAKYYQQAAQAGQRILQVDSVRSLLVLEVRRAGTFARLGHDHVVASHDVSGFVAPDVGRADLLIPLDKLVVDEKNLRDAAEFSPQPTPEDIAGTRHNMLSKVLETQHFPNALIHIKLAHLELMRNVQDSAKNSVDLVLNVNIILHGVMRTYSVPSTIQRTSNGMIVSGSMHFRQSDFGIVPFSILHGAIRVQDELALRFRIAATRR